MDEQLTSSEKRILDEFIKSVNETKLPSPFAHLLASIVSILGLVLFAAAVIITLNNLNDQTIYWVFFPGAIGGVGTIILGFILLKYVKRVGEGKRMATIIKKLLH
jgi:hypothetical protein